MRQWVLGLALMFTAPMFVEAANCVTLAAPGVPKSSRPRVIAQAMWDLAGFGSEMATDSVGVRIDQTDTDEICFVGTDPNGVLTDANLLSTWTTIEAEELAANAARDAREQSYKDELVANDLCDADLPTLAAKIDTWVSNRQGELDGASNFAQAKTHLRDELYPALGTAFKKIARCLQSRVELF